MFKDITEMHFCIRKHIVIYIPVSEYTLGWKTYLSNVSRVSVVPHEDIVALNTKIYKSGNLRYLSSY